MRRSNRRDHLSARRDYTSPLAAELNFVTNRYRKYRGKNSKNSMSQNYHDLPQSPSKLDEYLTQHSRYDIYSKCVV